jgi:hypothetical protein
MYTKQELIENFLGRELTERESNLLSTLIFTAERLIDKELGTTFKNTAALYGAVRYYDGGKRHIEIDPCQNVTAVAVVDTDLAVTDTFDSDTYDLFPSNETVKRMLTMRFGRVPRGYKNIKVTADFTEYAAEEGGVPSDIQTIATRIVGNMLMNAEAGAGLKSESVEGHQVTFKDNAGDIFEGDPIVKNLLDKRRIPLTDTAGINDLPEEAEDTLGLY